MHPAVLKPVPVLNHRSGSVVLLRLPAGRVNGSVERRLGRAQRLPPQDECGSALRGRWPLLFRDEDRGNSRAERAGNVDCATEPERNRSRREKIHDQQIDRLDLISYLRRIHPTTPSAPDANNTKPPGSGVLPVDDPEDPRIVKDSDGMVPRLFCDAKDGPLFWSQ